MGTEAVTKNPLRDDKTFGRKYLLLSPKDVGFWDLSKLLFSKNISHRKFIDCPEGTQVRAFGQRFGIFFSIIAQKFLALIDTPLTWFGHAIEYFLNLLLDNGGFFHLLINLVTGNLVLPHPRTAEFLSMIALSDIRRDLDSTIKRQDPRYKSHLAIMASKTAYENPAYIKENVEKHWNMEFLGFFNCWNDYEEDYTTQAFMWSDKSGDVELIGVAFRGTSPFNAKDWGSDVDLSWYKLRGIGKVHAGFLKALGMQKDQGWPKEIQTNVRRPYAYYVIREKLKERLASNPKAKILITGHSLGAALSIVFPAILALHKETEIISRIEGVYNFGQPRVGDFKFGNYMKEVLVTHGLRYHRYVYCNDLVPRVPFDFSNVYFKHFGVCHYYDSFYNGQVRIEEPNKNYFSLFAMIPMFLNAFWELLRSFFIIYTRGPDYSETFCCRGGRVFGLLIAGLSAHGPQDYVNLTRLGAPELFLA